jgi:hypothetical protein
MNRLPEAARIAEQIKVTNSSRRSQILRVYQSCSANVGMRRRKTEIATV